MIRLRQLVNEIIKEAGEAAKCWWLLPDGKLHRTMCQHHVDTASHFFASLGLDVNDPRLRDTDSIQKHFGWIRLVLMGYHGKRILTVNSHKEPNLSQWRAIRDLAKEERADEIFDKSKGDHVEIDETIEHDSPEKIQLIRQSLPYVNDDTMVVTVQNDPSFPQASFIQVDGFYDKKNLFSSNPETLNALGYKMPSSEDLLKTFPMGRYKMSDIRKKLHESEEAPPEEKPQFRGRKTFGQKLTYDELMQATTPARKEKAQHNVRVRSIPVSVDDEGHEQWNFRYRSDRETGDPGEPYKGQISFLKGEVGRNDSAEDLECEVDCECKDYMYRFAYNNAEKGAGQVGPETLSGVINRKPKPAYDYGIGLCKHLAALRKYLQTKIKSTGKSNLFEAVSDVAQQGPFTISYYD